MEGGALVAEALLTGAEGPEVLRSFGNHVGVELQEQTHSSQTSLHWTWGQTESRQRLRGCLEPSPGAVSSDRLKEAFLFGQQIIGSQTSGQTS